VTTSNKLANLGQLSQPKNTERVAPNQNTHSPIEEISALLDTLLLNAFVELTRRLLTSVPTVLSKPALSRLCSKSSFLS